ncbi:MAG: sugar phosphate isomerase/epimerase, partial [Planctomycetes bacterium]|nr:sugar phosphate isomerase/epimerase [Planctomycetota bacterium]
MNSRSITTRLSRRTLLQATAAAGTLLLSRVHAVSAEHRSEGRLHLATNQYPWFTFYGRDGRDFNKTLDAALGEVAASGMDGFEPLIDNPGQIDELAPVLEKHKLDMRSLYVNSTLHEEGAAEASIARVLTVAERAKAAGARIVVTNPNPIRWGGSEDKSDTQLRTQAAALDRLGQQLAQRGMTLAYHNHDAELRNAAREFHHMLVGTDSRFVTLCLDAHWIYRGAGNSSVALFDVVKLYGPRVSELHLRQSDGGPWTETFGPGDIDYPALVEQLARLGIKPHVVLEQAVE